MTHRFRFSLASASVPASAYPLLQTGIGSNLLTCSAMDTLAHALTLFAAAGGRAERIVCVDSERRVTGIVSLSDLFAYICSDESLPGALPSADEGPGSSAAAAVGLGMGLGGF